MSRDQPNSLVLFFIDGLGIGKADDDNPLFQIEDLAPLAHFRENEEGDTIGGILVRTDPRLGVEGRPQSASGQTTILTGVNAPELLGYHKQGFPNEALREVIRENSIFLQLQKLGIGPNVFANAYSPRFFTTTPRWKSATTCAVEASDLQFRRFSDLRGRKAVFHDFTNESLAADGSDIPLVSPGEAAYVLAEFSRSYRFTLYEHFLTDKIGHDRNVEFARSHLPRLAEFLRSLVANIDSERTTLILTSDHGNIEDLSVRTHTLNDVPTIIWGRNKEKAAAHIKDLADITPTIVRLLTE